ncbi:hypothetical protein BV898_17234 [Hypsibius exemplaris]|uniref:Uncharacterized protein n=1 Tax=Hypsibius exemplaris TaxID=2072580 RepID=A0A9X6RME0_HYPEX|nr:hypothetical protein BV898_17234 [Hypsibius exemplaris]
MTHATLNSFNEQLRRSEALSQLHSTLHAAAPVTLYAARCTLHAAQLHDTDGFLQQFLLSLFWPPSSAHIEAGAQKIPFLKEHSQKDISIPECCFVCFRLSEHLRRLE